MRVKTTFFSTNNKSFFDYLFVILIFFLLSLPLYIRSLYGSFLTYVLMATVSIIAMPRVIAVRGYGKAGVTDSLIMSISLCFFYVLGGFFSGFTVRASPSASSFFTGLAIFMISVASVEIARALAISLAPNIKAKVFLGVIIGLFYSRSLLAIKSYLTSSVSQPISLVSDIVFSLVITLLHIDGGFLVALVFRLAVSFFWRFSPLIPDKSTLGVAWSSLESLAIITIYAFLSTIHEFSFGKPNIIANRNMLSKSLSTIAKIAYGGILASLFIVVFGGFMPMVISSGSMTPTLSVGDVVLIKSQKEYSVGDVVAYRFMNQVVVHRIIDVSDKGFITKGDANSDKDPFIVPRESVIGRVSLKIPMIGWVSLALKNNINNSMLYIGSAIASIGLVSLFISRKRI
jgi:signal peptidase